ncbi:putative quinol monooxygenase [Dictyobacter formicarum]|uniref:ABM domain-containing protein n=1 Tax=Dictyobacter formicarum TaxID=2778368 RepID=A0ABQ3VL68_9CHLR|nr:antibiotic biosynthesis monooxygenase [Dictyobacter formicarum]GHO86957.1 hypothetical protein KSZ_49630 [Dictyobacter formicarum]
MTMIFRIIPGNEDEAMKLMDQLVRHTRTDPNILLADVYRSQNKSRKFFAYLQFTDQAALDSHRGSAYYGEYVLTSLYGMLETSSLTVETYKPLFHHEHHLK